MNKEEKSHINTDTISKEDSAINQKSNEANGKEINYQEKQRQEKRQPRDNA